MCGNLRKLNLKDNQIEDDDNLFYISSLPLVFVNLTGNPIHSRNNYKDLIKMNLPNLKALDTDFYDEELDGIEMVNSTFSSTSQDYWRPESSMTQRSTDINKVDIQASVSVENSGDLIRSVDLSQGLKPILRKHVNPSAIELLTTSPKKHPKNRETSEPQEIDITKSLNISKSELKPVIVKRSIDTDILLHTNRIDEEKEIAQEIATNIEKRNKSKAKVLQKHIIEDSNFSSSYRAGSSNKVILVLIFRYLKLII
jgi:hypothetical protein